MQSMTGFGAGAADGAGARITVEIRGVNQRHLDVRIAAPREYAAWERAASACAPTWRAGGRRTIVRTPLAARCQYRVAVRESSPVRRRRAQPARRLHAGRGRARRRPQAAGAVRGPRASAIRARSCPARRAVAALRAFLRERGRGAPRPARHAAARRHARHPRRSDPPPPAGAAALRRRMEERVTRPRRGRRRSGPVAEFRVARGPRRRDRGAGAPEPSGGAAASRGRAPPGSRPSSCSRILRELNTTGEGRGRRRAPGCSRPRARWKSCGSRCRTWRSRVLVTISGSPGAARPPWRGWWLARSGSSTCMPATSSADRPK